MNDEWRGKKERRRVNLCHRNTQPILEKMAVRKERNIKRGLGNVLLLVVANSEQKKDDRRVRI